MAYKNTVLLLNTALGGNKVKKEYIEDGTIWPKDLKTTAVNGDISIGQVLVDNARHRFTPFIGIGILEFAAADGEGEMSEDFRAYSPRWVYGLIYDVKFRKGIIIDTFEPYGQAERTCGTYHKGRALCLVR